MLSSGVDAGGVNTSKRKKCPSRGKRYSKAQKEEILHFAQANSVEEAAVKFNVTVVVLFISPDFLLIKIRHFFDNCRIIIPS